MQSTIIYTVKNTFTNSEFVGIVSAWEDIQNTVGFAWTQLRNQYNYWITECTVQQLIGLKNKPMARQLSTIHDLFCSFYISGIGAHILKVIDHKCYTDKELSKAVLHHQNCIFTPHTYYCPECGFGTYSIANWNAHTRTKKHALLTGQTIDYKYKCTECNYETNDCSNWWKHTRCLGHRKRMESLANRNKELPSPDSSNPSEPSTEFRIPGVEAMMMDKDLQESLDAFEQIVGP
jgi:hypothetical protein